MSRKQMKYHPCLFPSTVHSCIKGSEIYLRPWHEVAQGATQLSLPVSDWFSYHSSPINIQCFKNKYTWIPRLDYLVLLSSLSAFHHFWLIAFLFIVWNVRWWSFSGCSFSEPKIWSLHIACFAWPTNNWFTVICHWEKKGKPSIRNHNWQFCLIDLLTR